MEPEELAPFVLRHLAEQRQINRYNFTLDSAAVREYAGNDKETKCRERLMEAWMWLEKELMIAPKPGAQNDWYYVTERGRKVLEDQDFSSYASEALLPSEGLDPVLIRKVKPLFIRGDYDTAVLVAFKEVEVRVRKLGKLKAEDIGVDLMRKAFKKEPPLGPLADAEATSGERHGMMDLFAGAIATFKNPSSHRYVEFDDAREVADTIRTANTLLSILRKIGKTPVIP